MAKIHDSAIFIRIILILSLLFLITFSFTSCNSNIFTYRINSSKESAVQTESIEGQSNSVTGSYTDKPLQEATTTTEETTTKKEAIISKTNLSEIQTKILDDAKKQAEEKVINKSGYYEGGYPPDSEGTFADVIARALKNSGIDIRELMYQDMKVAKDQYPWDLYPFKEIDKNIDFRRTPNQEVFFRRNGIVLTNDFMKGDPNNLSQWQPGDFVYFSNQGDDWSETCGIISDKLNNEGVLLVIHNTVDPGYVVEDDFLLKYKIVGHCRYPK
jgi:hypothetical protein